MRIAHTPDGIAWRVPAVLREVRAIATPDGSARPALMVTPGALRVDGLTGLHAQVVQLDPADGTRSNGSATSPWRSTPRSTSTS